MIEVIKSTWSVTFTLPPEEKRSWVMNKHSNVVAATAERAIACLREHYPHCTIISVVKSGRNGETLVDDETNVGYDSQSMSVISSKSTPNRIVVSDVEVKNG